MKKWINRIILVLMAGIVMISSTGFVIGVHHCNSSKSDEFFMFQHDFKCEKELKKEKSCCCNSRAKENAVQQTNDGCCENKLVVVKLSLECPCYQIKQKIDSQKISAFIQNVYCSPLIVKEIVDCGFSNRPPPKTLSGQQITILFHSIKIPFDLA